MSGGDHFNRYRQEHTCGTNQPNGALRFGKETTASPECELFTAVQIVVRQPQPRALDISIGLRCEVQGHEGTCTVGDVGARGAVRLQVRSYSTTDADVSVPHTGTTLSGRSDVPFKNDRARCCTKEISTLGTQYWNISD